MNQPAKQTHKAPFLAAGIIYTNQIDYIVLARSRQAKSFLKAILGPILRAACGGHRVSLRGFVSFFISYR